MGVAHWGIISVITKNSSSHAEAWLGGNILVKGKESIQEEALATWKTAGLFRGMLVSIEIMVL